MKKKRLLPILVALLAVLGYIVSSGNTPFDGGNDTSIGIIGGADGPTSLYISDNSTTSATIEEDGWYYSAEDVALYLCTYDELPDNFITKDEAEDLGWEGGSVENYAPGCAIGGDSFGNREGLLPEAPGRDYYECDIDTDGRDSRGAKRIVYSDDGLIYYTDDHYESFVLLYNGD